MTRYVRLEDITVVEWNSKPPYGPRKTGTVIKWPRCWCGEPLKNSKVVIPAGTVVVQ